jgi:hypothetical protein
MCFLRECNVCASVRIFLQRNSFDQSHTERRAPQGGATLQRVNQVSHGDTWSLGRDVQRGCRG